MEYTMTGTPVTPDPKCFGERTVLESVSEVSIVRIPVPLLLP